MGVSNWREVGDRTRRRVHLDLGGREWDLAGDQPLVKGPGENFDF